MRCGLLVAVAAASLPQASQAAAWNRHIGWSPGATCPAGANNYNGSSGAYGKLGFDWVGDVHGYVDTNIGNPESCCQYGGGDGLAEVGLYYSLCNPELGCTEAGKAYTCTVYVNVTGTKPATGVLAGRAQAPVIARLDKAQTSLVASPYANPWTGACKAATSASAGFDERNATLFATATEHWQPHNPTPTSEFYNISGAICAPQCGCITPGHPQGQCAFGKLYSCTTANLPPGTTATPMCMLQSGMEDLVYSACALACDPSDPSGTGGPTSKCPAGATCQAQYSAGTSESKGIFATGICTYLPEITAGPAEDDDGGMCCQKNGPNSCLDADCSNYSDACC